MPILTIGTTRAQLPLVLTAPLIYIKARWSDAWELRPDLEFIEASFAVSAAGMSKAEFRSRYGDKIMLPGETDFTQREPLDIADYWVRITMVDPTQNDTIVIAFQGKIYIDTRDVEGNAARKIGKQPWVAYGPQRILQKIDVSRSFWLDNGDEKEIQWLPALNLRDARKLLVGNRSDEESNGSFLYGGKQLWTYTQYLAMTLARFVQQDSGEPTWTLSGQTDILDMLTRAVEFGKGTNAEQIFKKLITRDYGVDYLIFNTEEGFDIRVFSLLSKDNTFGLSTMPANPNQVRIERGNEIDMMSVKIVRSYDNQVDEFRIKGKRVVMCASLGGANAPAGAGDIGPGWADGLENEYKAGTGNADDDVDDHEKARRNHRFQPVYALFTGPRDWDYRGGELAPLIGLDGTVQPDPAPAQNAVRKTLSWTPLKEGFDYTDFDTSVYPPLPANNNDPDVEPEQIAPLAFLYDDGAQTDFSPGWIEAHANQMHVSVPHQDLGVLVHATPQHALALNHAFGPSSAEAETTDHDPIYDYDDLVATIAWECDQCLQVGYSVEESQRKNDGSRKEVHVDDAELWLLAASTVVGVDASGNLLQSPDAMMVLRDDTALLEAVAAGEIARYVEERVRCAIELKGFLPFVDLVGQILQVVEEAGDQNDIGAPITEIVWTGGKSAMTMLRTGYA